MAGIETFPKNGHDMEANKTIEVAIELASKLTYIYIYYTVFYYIYYYMLYIYIHARWSVNEKVVANERQFG